MEEYLQNTFTATRRSQGPGPGLSLCLDRAPWGVLSNVCFDSCKTGSRVPPNKMMAPMVPTSQDGSKGPLGKKTRKNDEHSEDNERTTTVH